MEAYFAAVHGLARQVTHAIAVALELPEDYFDDWFTTPMVIMSPLHYPPQAAADGGEISEARIGAGAHSDYGCLALLAQDDGAGCRSATRPGSGSTPSRSGDLRGQRRGHAGPLDQRPVPADPAPGHQHLGGRAPVHPLLLRPQLDAPVEVIPTVLREGEEPRYPPTTSLAHLQERFGATLPYLDERLVDADKADDLSWASGVRGGRGQTGLARWSSSGKTTRNSPWTRCSTTPLAATFWCEASKRTPVQGMIISRAGMSRLSSAARTRWASVEPRC
jgi:hypothetical protein